MIKLYPNIKIMIDCKWMIIIHDMIWSIWLKDLWRNGNDDWLIDGVNIETMGMSIDYNYYSLAYIDTESEYGLLLR